ncbi:hypothetical protein [Chromobacterium amazonense]|uniref:hypothetical protein n=1 Tax=Chromobacterium amazonense TaxID=1382803 RepID=UPI003F78EF67
MTAINNNSRTSHSSSYDNNISSPSTSFKGNSVSIGPKAGDRRQAQNLLMESQSGTRRFFQPLIGRVTRFFGAIPGWLRKPQASSPQVVPSPQAPSGYINNYNRR